MFSELYKNHAQNPKNFGKPKNFTNFGEAENPVCGDQTTFYLTIQNEKILEFFHVTEGCAGSIACASYVSELLKNKKITEITFGTLKQKILTELELSNTKKHCVELVEKALEETFKNIKN
ncbi:iron-sulfur cluster assembly scaffold protein [bacterium]|nr:iron-sulfur cluster assembly scaffold protein [bacterium]